MKRDGALTFVLATGAFTTMLHGSMLSPLLKGISTDFDVSVASVGQLATLYAGLAAVIAFAVAPLMDRYSRRAMLRFECSVLIVATLLSALAPSYAWLTVGRGLDGIGGAFIFGVCLAAAGDLFADPVERNRRIGIIASAGSIAIIAGQPLLTQVSAHAGWRWAVAATLVPPLVVLLGTRWLPSEALQAAEGRLWDSYRDRYRQVLASRETVWLLAVFIVMLSVWSAFSVYLGAYLETELRANANATSLIFLVSGVCFAAGSLIVPRVIERVPKRRANVTFATLLGINLLGAGVVYTSIPMVAVFVGVTALLGVSLYLTTGILLLDSLPEARGAVMALQSAGSEVGLALGAAWGGAVLVASNDNYVAVYRSLAFLLPVAMLCLMMSARSIRLRASPGREVAIDPGR
ncbi:MAG TPA: MFS transporter [Thermomicrobiales bacterium]|nr:MFS transporter [Thermomicrobiales bacterium]HRA30794.1 MFS transporter [Thermomicrobiales bacterium]